MAAPPNPFPNGVNLAVRGLIGQPGNDVRAARIPPAPSRRTVRRVAAATRDLESAVEELQLAADRATSITFRNVDVQPDVVGDGPNPALHDWIVHYSIGGAMRRTMLDEVQEAVRQHSAHHPQRAGEALYAHAFVTSEIIEERNRHAVVNGRHVVLPPQPDGDSSYGIATTHRYRVRNFGEPELRLGECNALVDELCRLLQHDAFRYEGSEVLWRFNYKDWEMRVVVAALRPINAVDGDQLYNVALRNHRPLDTFFSYETPADPHDAQGIWDGLDWIRNNQPLPPPRRAQRAVAIPRGGGPRPPPPPPGAPRLAPAGYNLRPRNAQGRVGALSAHVVACMEAYPPRAWRSTQPDGFCALLACLDWLLSRAYCVLDYQAAADEAMTAEMRQGYYTRLHTVQARIRRYSRADPDGRLRGMRHAVRHHLNLGPGDEPPPLTLRPHLTLDEVRELCEEMGVWTACYAHRTAHAHLGRQLPAPMWVAAGEGWEHQSFYPALMRGECNFLVWVPPEDEAGTGHVFRLLRPRQCFDGVQWCHVCRLSHATSDPAGQALVFCPQCDARLRQRCLARHREICTPGGACGVCGLSRTLHHRCVRHLAPVAKECRLLTRPDADYWMAVGERPEGEKKQQEAVDEAFRQARLAVFTSEVLESRDPVLRLVQANLHALLPLVFCYDFETVSPTEDLAEGGAAVRTHSQVRQEVLPIVFCAWQAQPYFGRQRLKVRFVGTDCAQRGAEWLRQRAEEAKSTSAYARLHEALFARPGADLGEEARRQAPEPVRPRNLNHGLDAPEAEGELEVAPDADDAELEAALREAEARQQRLRQQLTGLHDLHVVQEEGRAALASLTPRELSQLERKLGEAVPTRDELSEALRRRPEWSILAVGFNSARFDLPLILPEFPLEPVVQVNQGSDAFVKSVCVGGVKHVDLRLILGGSLAANYDSFRLPRDPENGKWFTPFHIFNAIPRERLPEAATLLLPRPTWEEWRAQVADDDAETLVRAERSWSSTEMRRCPPGMWQPFQWFADYCQSDCELLAILYRNSALQLVQKIGVLPLFECSTMASAAALGNRRHARYQQALQQVDFAPHQARLIREALFGGVCAVFAREAVGDCIALDVVSAYPAVCHQEGPLGGLPSGYLRNVPHYIGSGERLRPEDGALPAAERDALRQRMRETLRVNSEGVALLESLIHDHASRIFGWARAAVEVFVTHPVTGLRQILGPVPVRTLRGTVAYPVGCFYCCASLPTLREMEANGLGRVLRVYEGGYHLDLYPSGGESFPATSRMLLEKVLLSGYPAECADEAARERYRARVSEFFSVVLGGQAIPPDAIVSDKRRALVSKLCINAAWGFHVTRSKAAAVILTGRMADALHGETFRRLYGLPVPQQLPFSAAEWERLRATAHLPEAERLAVFRECRHVKVLLERNAAEGAQRALPLVETPALSLGAAVPDAMRRRLGNFCHALNALGAIVCYTDTDSVKIVLPPGCPWPHFRERLRAARSHPLLRRLLENGGGVGSLPGDFAPEGRFSEIVCLRPKGLAMRAYVAEKDFQREGAEAAPEGMRERVGKDKVVFSGVRDDDVGVPDFAGMKALLRRAENDPDAFFEVTGQLTFRVSTSCAERGGSGAARGGLPAAMVGIVGDKQFRRARTLSDTNPEASRVFESDFRTCPEAHLTWPPGVYCRARESADRDAWRSGRHEYLFTDDTLDPALYRLPDDASPEEGEQRAREELARRARSVRLRCWERPRYFDAEGVARAPTQADEEVEEVAAHLPPPRRQRSAVEEMALRFGEEEEVEAAPFQAPSLGAGWGSEGELDSDGEPRDWDF